MDAVRDILEWLDDNQEAEKEDYDAKQKELEAIANPIISAAYQASGSAGKAGEDEYEEDEDEEDEDEL